ncbi:LOW QUALITY PROTEIN: interferon-induced very large GTPase 1-like [Passer montanus]|uniref:LOW QUALITY PROTEIN: interferon-induced very large GTPase 1-like n=1 Tax=Passer montanus TaxID=9160 RepID=UPI001961E904|nr:LOW QUALITY PROTEIN: interferon-induced very large GTPase 1-like [Passer montanus]
MDNRGKKLLQDLWQSQRPLVCLLTEKENTAAGQVSKTITIGIKNRNEAEVMDQLTKTIGELLQGSNPCFSLETCVDKARQHGFIVDADQPACVTAKAKAKELVELLKKEKLSEIKSKLLPLQGKLWYQWCQKDKELTRLQEKGNKSIEHHRSQIESEKKAIRRKQLDKAFPLNPLMKSFLGFLHAQPADTKKYFLQWMKVFMDELSCGRLEELRRDYHELHSKILSRKKYHEKSRANVELLSRLDVLSDEINDSSIGLEHLLREVGQIYEALELNCKKDNFLKMPEIAAEQQLKSKILQAAKNLSQCSILRFSSLKDRIGDLWNALLNENFVFSFKNSLEIAVYRKLETAFSQWTWRLRSHILDVQMRLDNKIRNGDLQNVTREHLEGLVRETSDAIEKEVENYFREDKDRETLVQWKSSTELKLKELKKTLLHETKKKCENLIELQNDKNKLVARKLEYEDELLRRSQELAVSLKGKSLSERELKDNFTLVWNKWIADVSHGPNSPEQVDIDKEIEDVLGEHFKESGIHARIRSFPRGRGFYLDPEKHIMKKKHLGYVPHLKSFSNAGVINFQHITDNIIACVKANISKKEEEKQDYSRNFIYEILNEVQNGVNSVPSNATCTFNREYSMDLSLYLCRMAAGRFKTMHKKFQK